VGRHTEKMLRVAGMLLLVWVCVALSVSLVQSAARRRSRVRVPSYCRRYVTSSYQQQLRTHQLTQDNDDDDDDDEDDDDDGQDFDKGGDKNGNSNEDENAAADGSGGKEKEKKEKEDAGAGKA